MLPPKTLVEAARRLADGTLQAVTLTEYFLNRIATLDPILHAFVHIAEKSVMAQAAAADQERRNGRDCGPLHGIPIAVKDVIHVAAMPTTAQSKQLVGEVAETDAPAVRRLRNAGALVLGKLNTHEFAFWGPCDDLPFPPARNPWNTDCYTGGSSSGGGAAVAAGLCLGAVGSDTGGSIRTPAALCGVVGYKPTYELISRDGLLPLAPSLDHVGGMAWTVSDCALLVWGMGGAIVGSESDPLAALTGDISDLRVGVPQDEYLADLDGPVGSAFDAMLDVVRHLGARIVKVKLPPLEDCHACGIVVLLAEAYAIHRQGLAHRFDEYGCHLREQLPLGALITAADYLSAQRRRRAICALVAEALESADVIATPAHASTAQRIAEIQKFAFRRAPFKNILFNLTGGPALTVCIGFGADGLPFGAQFACRPRDDAVVLRVGDAYERATPWRQRCPAI